MSRPPDRRERETPGLTATGGSQRDRDSEPSKSPSPPFPSLDHEPPSTVDLASPIVDLIHELRPDIPLSIVASLAVECLDLSACLHLDGEWAEARQRIWPEAVKAAHSRHVGAYPSLAERLAEARRPRSGGRAVA